MRFAVLGPVQVGEDGTWRGINGMMPRTVLAALLLQPNTAVSTDSLADAVWGGRPPATSAASLHNHVARLRRALGEVGAARIRAAPLGYLIRVEPGELDADEFTRLSVLAGRAAAEGRWAEASGSLAEALAQWRGRRMADVPSLDGHPRLCHLHEARIQAQEAWIEAELHLGRHREMLAELRRLTADHPLREAFHGQLMRALSRVGGQAAALEVFPWPGT